MGETPRIPNLYQLLGLAPLESDEQQIVAALKKVQARLKALKVNAQPTKADEQARVQKLLTLGQQLLMDQDRKAQYDRDWKTVYGSQSSSSSKAKPQTAVAAVAGSTASTEAINAKPLLSTNVAMTELTWNMDHLESLLPSGDPQAAFDMAEYLRNSQVRDPAAAEADLNKLISLLGGEPLPTRTPSSTPIATTITSAQLDIPLVYASTEARAHDDPSAPSEGLAIGPSAKGQKAASTLAKRMRKRQQRSLLLGGLGLVGGVLALAGLFVYLNQGKQPKAEVAQGPNKPKPVAPAPAEPTPAPLAGAAQPTKPNDKPSPAVSGSGLVQPGQLSQPLQIQAKPVQVDEMKAEPAMTNQPAPAQPPKTAEPPTPTEPSAPTPTPTPTDTPAPEPTKTEATKSESMEPSPTTVVDKPLTEADKREWLRGMKSASVALGKLDVPTAQKHLEELKSNIKNKQQQAQHGRLTEVAVLVSSARQLIVDAIKKLEPGQELTIKSTKVAFVSGDENQLVIFQNKTQRRFKLEELPAGVAEALIDQNLLDAKLLAAKGAYLMLHPKNTAVQGVAKQALEDAAQSGAISPELAKFYEDDYSK